MAFLSVICSQRHSSTSASAGGSDTHLQPPPSSPCRTRRAASSPSSNSGRLMGLAVLVTASEGDTRTLFENSVFVEDVVNRLRARCVNAFFSGEKFLHQMHREEEEDGTLAKAMWALQKLQIVAKRK